MAIRRNLGIPAGVVFQSAATAAPYGYLVCDGSEVLKTDYPALYAAIGDTYGTPTGGSLYFCLPDYRGRFLRGHDGSAGNDPDKLTRTAMKAGAIAGNNVGSLQDDANKSHIHQTAVSGTASTANGVGNNTPFATANNSGGNAFYTLNGVPGGTADVGPTSSNGGADNRPKNVSVNFIIKY